MAEEKARGPRTIMGKLDAAPPPASNVIKQQDVRHAEPKTDAEGGGGDPDTVTYTMAPTATLANGSSAERVSAIFRMYDPEGKGWLDLQELMSALGELGVLHGLSQKKLAEVVGAPGILSRGSSSGQQRHSLQDFTQYCGRLAQHQARMARGERIKATSSLPEVPPGVDSDPVVQQCFASYCRYTTAGLAGQANGPSRQFGKAASSAANANVNAHAGGGAGAGGAHGSGATDPYTDLRMNSAQLLKVCSDLGILGGAAAGPEGPGATVSNAAVDAVFARVKQPGTRRLGFREWLHAVAILSMESGRDLFLPIVEGLVSARQPKKAGGQQQQKPPVAAPQPAQQQQQQQQSGGGEMPAAGVAASWPPPGSAGGSFRSTPPQQPQQQPAKETLPLPPTLYSPSGTPQGSGHPGAMAPQQAAVGGANQRRQLAGGGPLPPVMPVPVPVSMLHLPKPPRQHHPAYHMHTDAEGRISDRSLGGFGQQQQQQQQQGAEAGMPSPGDVEGGSSLAHLQSLTGAGDGTDGGRQGYDQLRPKPPQVGNFLAPIKSPVPGEWLSDTKGGSSRAGGVPSTPLLMQLLERIMGVEGKLDARVAELWAHQGQAHAEHDGRLRGLEAWVPQVHDAKARMDGIAGVLRAMDARFATLEAALLQRASVHPEPPLELQTGSQPVHQGEATGIAKDLQQQEGREADGSLASPAAVAEDAAARAELVARASALEQQVQELQTRVRQLEETPAPSTTPAAGAAAGAGQAAPLAAAGASQPSQGQRRSSTQGSNTGHDNRRGSVQGEARAADSRRSTLQGEKRASGAGGTVTMATGAELSLLEKRLAACEQTCARHETAVEQEIPARLRVLESSALAAAALATPLTSTMAPGPPAAGEQQEQQQPTQSPVPSPKTLTAEADSTGAPREPAAAAAPTPVTLTEEAARAALEQCRVAALEAQAAAQEARAAAALATVASSGALSNTVSPDLQPSQSDVTATTTAVVGNSGAADTAAAGGSTGTVAADPGELTSLRLAVQRWDADREALAASAALAQAAASDGLQQLRGQLAELEQRVTVLGSSALPAHGHPHDAPAAGSASGTALGAVATPSNGGTDGTDASSGQGPAAGGATHPGLEERIKSVERRMDSLAAEVSDAGMAAVAAGTTLAVSRAAAPGGANGVAGAATALEAADADAVPAVLEQLQLQVAAVEKRLLDVEVLAAAAQATSHTVKQGGREMADAPTPLPAPEQQSTDVAALLAADFIRREEQLASLTRSVQTAQESASAAMMAAAAASTSAAAAAAAAADAAKASSSVATAAASASAAPPAAASSAVEAAQRMAAKAEQRSLDAWTAASAATEASLALKGDISGLKTSVTQLQHSMEDLAQQAAAATAAATAANANASKALDEATTATSAASAAVVVAAAVPNSGAADPRGGPSASGAPATSAQLLGLQEQCSRAEAAVAVVTTAQQQSAVQQAELTETVAQVFRQLATLTEQFAASHYAAEQTPEAGAESKAEARQPERLVEVEVGQQLAELRTLVDTSAAVLDAKVAQCLEAAAAAQVLSATVHELKAAAEAQATAVDARLSDVVTSGAASEKQHAAAFETSLSQVSEQQQVLAEEVRKQRGDLEALQTKVEAATAAAEASVSRHASETDQKIDELFKSLATTTQTVDGWTKSVDQSATSAAIADAVRATAEVSGAVAKLELGLAAVQGNVAEQFAELSARIAAVDTAVQQQQQQLSADVSTAAAASAAAAASTAALEERMRQDMQAMQKAAADSATATAAAAATAATAATAAAADAGSTAAARAASETKLETLELATSKLTEALAGLSTKHDALQGEFKASVASYATVTTLRESESRLLDRHQQLLDEIEAIKLSVRDTLATGGSDPNATPADQSPEPGRYASFEAIQAVEAAVTEITVNAREGLQDLAERQQQADAKVDALVEAMAALEDNFAESMEIKEQVLLRIAKQVDFNQSKIKELREAMEHAGLVEPGPGTSASGAPAAGAR